MAKKTKSVMNRAIMKGVREEGADSAAERGFAGKVLKCFMAKCTKYRRGK